MEMPYADGKMKITFRRCDADVALKLAQSAAALRGETQGQPENVVLAGHQGAVDALISSALSMMQSPSALPVVLEALAVVLMNAENRERLGPRGVAVIVMMLIKHLVAVLDGSADDTPTFLAACGALRATTLSD